MVIAAIVLLLVMVYFLFGDKLFNSDKGNFIQELIDMKIMSLDEETAEIYSGYIMTGSEIFEDKYVKVELEQYILFDNMVLAKFVVKNKSDEDLVADGSSWNLKSNISYDGGNRADTEGYSIMLADGEDNYIDMFSLYETSKETDNGFEIYIKAYFFEKSDNYKYVVCSSNKNTGIALEKIKTNEVVVSSESGKLIITPHIIYTYEEPDFDRLELEYSDGRNCTAINNKKEYITYSSDEERLWYYISDTIYDTDRIKKVYLDETEYVYNNNSQMFIKE